MYILINNHISIFFLSYGLKPGLATLFFCLKSDLLCIFSGSAERHTDSWMFCVSLCHFPQTHRADGGRAPVSRGSRSSHWLIPAQTFPFGSRAGRNLFHCPNRLHDHKSKESNACVMILNISLVK